MKSIVFDGASLTSPYRLKRCTYQLMHLALAAHRSGMIVKFVTSPEHYESHKFIECLGGMLTEKLVDSDIYVGKSDAFYKDVNFDKISSLKAFKVCLCNSDRCFREQTGTCHGHTGNAVQERCDLYMPVNHTTRLLKHFGQKVIPACHPIDPRMYGFLKRKGLYTDYLDNNVKRIRAEIDVPETGQAGFMGSRNPGRDRLQKYFPDWIEFNWDRSSPSKDYVKWMMSRRGCVDLRGHGDKSLRFTEAALLGKTIITSKRESTYFPTLKHGVNCLEFISWESMRLEYDFKHWLVMSEAATEDYVNGWSMLGQINTICKVANA